MWNDREATVMGSIGRWRVEAMRECKIRVELTLDMDDLFLIR